MDGDLGSQTMSPLTFAFYLDLQFLSKKILLANRKKILEGATYLLRKSRLAIPQTVKR